MVGAIIRGAVVVLRISGILALLLGLLFWSGNGLALISLHIGLGLLMVLSLWLIGVAQALRGGSWLLAGGALLFGALVLGLGMRQGAILPGALHWIVELAHLLLSALVVGFGQMLAARARPAGAGPSTAGGVA